MLPQPDHTPSGSLQRGVVRTVTSDRALELCLPEVGISAGVRRVNRATMPEAPVYKDGDLVSAEYDVRPDAPAVEFEAAVLPKAKAPRMKFGSQEPLRTRVHPAVGLHGPAGDVTARQRRRAAHRPKATALSEA